jgi:hypothetical protein
MVEESRDIAGPGFLAYGSGQAERLGAARDGWCSRFEFAAYTFRRVFNN